MNPSAPVWTALFCLVACVAQAQPADPNGPRLEVENKELDFGTIMHGAKTQLKAKLTNTGKSELIIRQVKPSCGCTVADYPRKLAPGASGFMQLTFDSTERPAGYQSFRVAVYTNDPTQRDLGNYCTLLALRGEVKTLYRIAPHGAYFGEFVRGMDSLEKVVTVTGKGIAAKGFTAELSEDPPSYLQVELGPLPANDKRKGVHVKIRLLPHAPLGQLDEALLFKTNISEQPLFRIPAVALINNRVTGPPAVHLGAVPRGQSSTRMIVIERRDKVDGLNVARMAYDERLLTAKHKGVSARRVEIELSVREDAPPGPFATLLDVYLDDEHQQLVRVPVYGLVAAQVSVDPPTALLPQGTKPGAEVATFTVRVPKGRKVIGVTTDGKGLSAKVDAQDRAWRVTVSADSGEPPAKATLVVQTDVSGEERVEVPLLRQ